MKDIRFRRRRLRRRTAAGIGIIITGRIVEFWTLLIVCWWVSYFLFRALRRAVLMVSVNCCWSSFLVAVVVVLVRFGSPLFRYRRRCRYKFEYHLLVSASRRPKILKNAMTEQRLETEKLPFVVLCSLVFTVLLVKWRRGGR